MRNKLFLILAIAVLGLTLVGCAAPVASAQTPGTTPPLRQLTATGTGKIYLNPDVAYIYIGVHAQADAVSDALSQNNDKSQAVAGSLKEQGVDAKDIQTSAFNVNPVQEYDKNGQPTKMTYTVDNSVYVTVRDLSKLGQILDAVVRNGANNINGINFDVTDKAKAVSEARTLAIQQAKQMAQEMASAAGVSLGDLQTMNVYASNGPVPMFEAKGGGAAASVAATVPTSSGQLVLSMDATLVYEIK